MGKGGEKEKGKFGANSALVVWGIDAPAGLEIDSVKQAEPGRIGPSYI